MPEISPWRSRFLDFVQQLRNERMLPASAMVDDPEQTMKLTLYVDGVRFEVLHHPLENCDHYCVVHSHFGALPRDHRRTQALQQALQHNHTLAVHRAGMFVLDSTIDTLIWSQHELLENIDAPSLLQAMQTAALVAHQWRMTYGSDEDLLRDEDLLSDSASAGVFP